MAACRDASGESAIKEAAEGTAYTKNTVKD
jgi:hypothetical protein